MSQLIVDDLGDLTPWRALAPDGTPSTAMTLASGTQTHLGGATARITAEQATGHRLERTLPETGLGSQSDLQLWLRSDRVADGSAVRPYFLELRLGSAQHGIGTPGNPWHRLLPFAAANVWQPVVLSIDDLPAGVREALTSIRVACVDGSEPFTVDFGVLLAIRDEPLVDVDAALTERLHGRLRLDGTVVPAVVTPVADPPEPPFLRLTNYALRRAPERSPTTELRTDYTETAFSVRPPSTVYDLFYEIDAVADDRADAARMLDFVLAELASQSQLVVNNRPLPVEWVDEPRTILTTPVATVAPERPLVRLRVSASQPSPTARLVAVPPFSRIDLEVEPGASA